MKKICSLLVITLLLATALPAKAEQASNTAALIMDFETGQILYAENIDAPLPPASITKLITMHLVFEAIAEGKIGLGDQVKASANATSLPDGSATIFLGTGEVLTVEELLEAVAIISANDAGIALAEHIAGSESAFVHLMNEKAVELGLTNTTFINVHGLHTPSHLMSARDIALLSRATLQKFPEITDYSKLKYLRMERDKRYVRQGYFDLHSTYANLIGWRHIDGLKTGWTPEAGRCITVTAAENDRRHIVVVMGEKSISERDQKVKELLAQAFDQFRPVVLRQAGEAIESMFLSSAKNKEVETGVSQDVTILLARTEDPAVIHEEIELLPGLKAPMKKGDPVGTLSFYRGIEQITSVDLILNEDAERAGFFTRSFRFLSALLASLAKWVIGLFS